MKTRQFLLGLCAATLAIPLQAQEITLKGKELFGDITARQIGPALMSGRIIDMETHPTNAQVIYTGTAGGGVWKSQDGGASYAPIFDDHIQSIGQVAIDPTDPDQTVWVGTGEIWTRNSVSVGDGLYRTRDGGANWDYIKGFENSERISGIEIHPEDGKTVYVGALWSDSEDRGVYKTTDGGATWNKILYVDQKTGVSDLIMDPTNPNILYASMWEHRRTAWNFNSGGLNSGLHKSTDGGVYRSWNGGTTMEIVSNLPLSQFYQISVDNAEPYRIYGGLQDNGSWYGPSSSPGGIEARDWVRVGVGDGFRVLPHPTKEILYSEMQGADNVWRYDMERNYTKNVKPLPAKGSADLRFNWNPPMATSAHQPDRFYMGSQFLHVSEDMGDTWKVISPDLTTNDPSKQEKNSGGLSADNSGAETHTTIFTIAESPVDQKVIWVGTDDGNVQVTKNSGKSWENVVVNVPGLPANTWVYHIEASVHGAGIAYAVFEGHARGDMKPYVYKTTDYGKSWKSIITDDIPIFARNIQEDYENENLLFLGTEKGLYITVDGGEKWSHFTNNFPPTAIHFLDLQKQTNDLVAGTHGRGVIIIDDISILREIKPEIIDKNVHFFPTKTSIMVEEGGFGGTATELEFVGPNPGTSLNIKYYLKKRHTFGKMTLTIEDMEGNEVTTLSAGKSKGINIVSWNYTTKAPKLATAKTFAFGGFTSLRAKAGTYKAILKKGKESYETTFEIKNDPKSFITKTERAEQTKVSKELFDVQEDLAYMVYQINLMSTKATDAIEKDSKAKKTAQPLIDELDTLRNTLVVTTGDNYVGTAPPQLREKLSTLYSDVAANFEAPSAAQKDNIKLLTDRFKNSQADFEKIKTKQFTKFSKYLEKAGEQAIEFKTKEAFIDLKE